MENLYELKITNEQVKKELGQSREFHRIENGITVFALSESDARERAYEQYPMCDIYHCKPGVNPPDNPVIFGKYPNLWRDENLTSCLLKI